MKRPAVALVLLLPIAAALACGGGEDTPAPEQNPDTTDHADSEGLHPLRIYGGTEDPASGEAGVTHSGAFLILEDARSTADQANETIDRLETTLEDIR